MRFGWAVVLVSFALADSSILAASGLADSSHPSEQDASPLPGPDSIEWHNLEFSVRPPKRVYHVMGYDSVNHRTVLFSGWNGWPDYKKLNDLWAYDFGSNRWELMPNRGPHPDETHYGAMAFDSESARFVLFGGESDMWESTWTYDLARNTWNRMSPARSPPGRSGAALAYDGNHDRVVLFGGRGGAYLNDTWLYDLNNNTWTSLPLSGSPPGRRDHAMVYDSSSDRLIMAGGSRIEPYVGFNDTWALNLETLVWENLTSAAGASGPSRMERHSLAYDSQSDRVIFFGGCCEPNSYVGETWEFDYESRRWTKMHPVSHPLPRANTAVSYDDLRDRVILFGGDAGPDGHQQDTWVYDYDNDTWRAMDILPRHGHTLTCMGASQRCLLFGGGDYLSSPATNDTWTYDTISNSWYWLDPITKPLPRKNHVAAFHDATQLVVMFGGRGSPAQGSALLNDTWVFDAASEEWTLMSPRESPSPREGAHLFYDSGSSMLFLHGGRGAESGPLNDTWAYDPTVNVWHQLPSIPSGQKSWRPGVFLDPVKEVLVVIDGYLTNRTWEYSIRDSIWRELPITPAGPEFYRHAVLYDPVRGRALVLGELNYSTHAWYYDRGSRTWTEVTQVNQPRFLDEYSLSYAQGSGDILMLGGWWRLCCGGFWSFRPPSLPPLAPENLTAMYARETVNLRWDPPATNGGMPILGYRIYRAPADAPESLLHEVQGSTSFDDQGISQVSVYTYRVTALNFVGEGPPSEPVSIEVRQGPIGPLPGILAQGWIVQATLVALTATVITLLLLRKRMRRGPQGPHGVASPTRA